MRTPEQIEKKLKKLERKFRILHKYREDVNFDVSNFSIPASDCVHYEKEIKYVGGSIKSYLLVIR